MSQILCPGCGLVHKDAGLTPPVRLSASGECHAEYAKVLSAFYEPDVFPQRQYVVDAYACTHPDPSTRRGIQTTALCLMTLDLYLECGQPVSEGSAMHQEMMREGPVIFTRLEPPSLHGVPTHRLLLDAPRADYAMLAHEWAFRVWHAWTPHHEQIRAWNLQLVTHRVRA